METTSVSKIYSLNKSTYINLRWIGIIGQFLTINIVYFIFKFQFNIYLTNLIIFLGVLSNLILIYFYQKNILSNRASFIFFIFRYFATKFFNFSGLIGFEIDLDNASCKDF